MNLATLLLLVAGLTLGAAIPARAAVACPNQTRSNTQRLPQQGKCPGACSEDTYTTLANRATLALNSNPPTCPAGCVPGNVSNSAPDESCRQLSPTNAVCQVKITRTLTCTPEEEGGDDNGSGVEDPLLLTLLFALAASLIIRRVFRRA